MIGGPVSVCVGTAPVMAERDSYACVHVYIRPRVYVCVCNCVCACASLYR
jgi:hypothetical protein